MAGQRQWLQAMEARVEQGEAVADGDGGGWLLLSAWQLAEGEEDENTLGFYHPTGGSDGLGGLGQCDFNTATLGASHPSDGTAERKRAAEAAAAERLATWIFVEVDVVCAQRSEERHAEAARRGATYTQRACCAACSRRSQPLWVHYDVTALPLGVGTLQARMARPSRPPRPKLVEQRRCPEAEAPPSRLEGDLMSQSKTSPVAAAPPSRWGAVREGFCSCKDLAAQAEAERAAAAAECARREAAAAASAPRTAEQSSGAAWSRARSRLGAVRAIKCGAGGVVASGAPPQQGPAACTVGNRRQEGGARPASRTVGGHFEGGVDHHAELGSVARTPSRTVMIGGRDSYAPRQSALQQSFIWSPPPVSSLSRSAPNLLAASQSPPPSPPPPARMRVSDFVEASQWTSRCSATEDAPAAEAVPTATASPIMTPRGAVTAPDYHAAAVAMHLASKRRGNKPSWRGRAKLPPPPRPVTQAAPAAARGTRVIGAAHTFDAAALESAAVEAARRKCCSSHRSAEAAVCPMPPSPGTGAEGACSSTPPSTSAKVYGATHVFNVAALEAAAAEARSLDAARAKAAPGKRIYGAAHAFGASRLEVAAVEAKARRSPEYLEAEAALTRMRSAANVVPGVRAAEAQAPTSAPPSRRRWPFGTRRRATSAPAALTPEVLLLAAKTRLPLAWPVAEWWSGGWRLCVAWCYFGGLLFGGLGWLVLLLRARQSAGVNSDAFYASYSFAVAQAWVIQENIKVILVTIIAPQFWARFLKPGTKRAEALRAVMQFAHNALTPML
jgi:hypothetical protein